MTAPEDHSFSPESYSSPDGTTTSNQIYDEPSSGNLGEEGGVNNNNNNSNSKKKSSSASSGRKGPGGADKRANHNAIERARRESLNGRFMTLAEALPSMASVKRPSKSIIVNKALDFVFDAQVKEHALIKENNDLRKEVDQLRARLGMSPLPPPTPLPVATTPTPTSTSTSYTTNATSPSLHSPTMNTNTDTINRVVESTPELSLPIPMLLSSNHFNPHSNSHGFSTSFDSYQDELNTASGISPSSQHSQHSFGSTNSPIDESTSSPGAGSASTFFGNPLQGFNHQQQQQQQLQAQQVQAQQHQIQLQMQQHQQNLQHLHQLQHLPLQHHQQLSQQLDFSSPYNLNNTSYLLSQAQSQFPNNSHLLGSGNLLMGSVTSSALGAGIGGELPWLAANMETSYGFMT